MRLHRRHFTQQILNAAYVAFSLFLAGASPGLSQTRALTKEEFVGSIPADDISRAFVGGLATNVPCHCITWRLTFSTNLNAPAPAKFTSSATYGLQEDRSESARSRSDVEVQGEWEMVRGTKAKPNAVVYRLYAEGRKKSVSLVRVGENILHFLDEDKTLRVGNANFIRTDK